MGVGTVAIDPYGPWAVAIVAIVCSDTRVSLFQFIVGALIDCKAGTHIPISIVMMRGGVESSIMILCTLRCKWS